MESISAKIWDVLVVGAGNAGLCAAISAAERGCSVLVIEVAPRYIRGGNTRHTRNLRVVHDVPTNFLSGRYSFDEYRDDLIRVTKGMTNKPLAELTLARSESLVDWLTERGVRFQQALSGTLNLERTNIFFLGGGRTLLNSLCRHAEKVGVSFVYDTEVARLQIENGFCSGLIVRHTARQDEVTQHIRCRQLVAAAGGFEANLDWLAEGWGEAAKNFIVRGTPYNRGEVLKSLFAGGAKSVGALDQCHAVAIDARAPKYDGGIASRLDAVPFAVVLNKNSERFYDEGEDFWAQRYAIWGRLVAQQPDQIAYAIIDADGLERFMPSVFPAITSDNIGSLAEQLGLDSKRTYASVATYNAACPAGVIDPKVLDGKTTNGLSPEKTNWAARIERPPFYGYPLRPGITFTYMGVEVDAQARVTMTDGRAASNIFAAGEIMAGNILGQGYLAGIGMTIGGVFGRIAGEAAAHGLNG